jgi:hypothetical protein
MLKSSPIAGAIVLALSLPMWAAMRRHRRAADALSPLSGLGLVTITVVLVALAALAVALLGRSPGTLSELVHGH